MKIGIIGSDSLNKAEEIFPIIHNFIEDRWPQRNVVVVGIGLSGITPLVKRWCDRRGIDFIGFPHYDAAIINVDEVLAIWDGTVQGPSEAVRYAKELGVPVMIVRV